MKSNDGVSSEDNFSNQGNVKLTPPVFIGENVIVTDSTIGPYVSVGENCIISDSIVESTLIYNNVKVANATIKNSILGSNTIYDGSNKEIFLGDYSQIGPYVSVG